MNISTQITGERISQAVAAQAAAEETLAEVMRYPSALLVVVNTLSFAVSTFAVVGQFGTRLEALLGALAGAAFGLALTNYSNGLRQRKHVEAMLCLMRKTAP